MRRTWRRGGGACGKDFRFKASRANVDVCATIDVWPGALAPKRANKQSQLPYDRFRSVGGQQMQLKATTVKNI
jgi:hypothetical protein